MGSFYVVDVEISIGREDGKLVVGSGRLFEGAGADADLVFGIMLPETKGLDQWLKRKSFEQVHE